METTCWSPMIAMEYDRGIPENLVERLDAFYSQESLIIKKHSRKGETETNILPMLCEKKIRSVDEQLLDDIFSRFCVGK